MAVQDPNFTDHPSLEYYLRKRTNAPSYRTNGNTTDTVTKKVRILSIDGGGIRGIIPATIIQYLEETIQQRTGKPEARICDYFDLIAGTSTGGILTCAYLNPAPHSGAMGRPMTAGEALDLYKVHGKEIFTLPLRRRLRTLFSLTEKKYCSRPMEQLLQEKFGRKTKLSGLLKPCLITAYNFSTRQGLFFNQLEAKVNPARDFRVWEVARATSAAPTYFEPARLQSESGGDFPLLDGGMVATNPAMCAYIEAHKTAYSQVDPERNMPDNPICRDILMVSISTGNLQHNYEFEKLRRYSKIQWAKPVIDMMISACSETVHYQVQHLFDTCQQIHGSSQSNYYRINPELRKADSCIDNVRNRNLQALHRSGLAYVEQNKAQLERLVERLVD